MRSLLVMCCLSCLAQGAWGAANQSVTIQPPPLSPRLPREMPKILEDPKHRQAEDGLLKAILAILCCVCIALLGFLVYCVRVTIHEKKAKRETAAFAEWWLQEYAKKRWLRQHSEAPTPSGTP